MQLGDIIVKESLQEENVFFIKKCFSKTNETNCIIIGNVY